MSLNIFWFLPTHGDGRYLGTEEGARPVDYGYLQQIAQTADRLGFTGVLIPTGRSCEDAWAGRGLNDPGDAAAEVPCRPQAKRGIADGGRASGGDPRPAVKRPGAVQSGHRQRSCRTGRRRRLPRPHERYEASAEFTHIWRKLMEGETVTFNGKHQRVRDAKLLFPPLQQPRPPLYFGGSSEVAQELAAEQVDLYLTWGEPPAQWQRK